MSRVGVSPWARPNSGVDGPLVIVQAIVIIGGAITNATPTQLGFDDDDPDFEPHAYDTHGLRTGDDITITAPYFGHWEFSAMARFEFPAETGNTTLHMEILNFAGGWFVKSWHDELTFSSLPDPATYSGVKDGIISTVGRDITEETTFGLYVEITNDSGMGGSIENGFLRMKRVGPALGEVMS